MERSDEHTFAVLLLCPACVRTFWCFILLANGGCGLAIVVCMRYRSTGTACDGNTVNNWNDWESALTVLSVSC